jgi:NAD(P)-dependent dehydrogenase (short-subunit alcohol dehydrogenase family)
MRRGGGDRGAVLVTGASTGIGEAVARGLAQRGNAVYAGVRKEADADRLAATNLTPVILDITDEAQVGEVAARLAADVGEAGLAGVVNNAGIALGGPLEYLALDEWRNQLEVNVIGQVAVTRATLPLLRSGPGRIVFVGSISGRVGTTLMGPYCSSKFAIEGLAESLRHDLAEWGIRVAVVEPGAVKTAIWEKGRVTTERLERELPAEAFERYGKGMDSVKEGIEKNDENGVGPEKVADAVAHALFARRPKHRYLVGPDAKVAGTLSRLLPDRAKHAVMARLAGP